MRNSTNCSTGSGTRAGDGGHTPSSYAPAADPRPGVPAFLYRQFQEGLLIETRSGIGLEDFLNKGLGIDRQYISTRIATIFLDGAPVEDLQGTGLKEGSVVALSAAMPGLAGSIFRRGGHLAALRSRVTKEQKAPSAASRIFVKVKIFNSLIPELAEGILRKGVWLKASSVPEDVLRQGGFSVEKDTSIAPEQDRLVRIILEGSRAS